MHWKTWLMIVAVVSLLAPFAGAGELVVSVEFVPRPEPRVVNTEVEVLALEPSSFAVNATEGRWEYRFEKEKDLFGVVLFRLSSPPSGYWNGDVELRIPFFWDKKEVDVTVTAVNVDPSADEVRDLYATPVVEMRPVRQFVFHHRAWFVSSERMRRVGHKWDEVSDYDVQAVFKFLESSRELASRRYLRPGRRIMEARDWLHESLAKRKRVVRRAVSEGSARQLIEQIDSLDGIFWGELFRNIGQMIADQPQRTRGCSLMEGFRANLERMLEDQLHAILRVAKIDLAIVQSALAQCAVFEAKAGKAWVRPRDLTSAMIDKLEKQIRALEGSREKAATEVARRLVDSDIRVLRELLP